MQVLNKISKKLAWIILGCIIAFAVSNILISDSGNLNKFYGGGEVYDVRRSDLKTNWDNTILYDAQELVWRVNSDIAAKYMDISMGKWEYVYVLLARVNTEYFDADIACYNQNSECVYTDRVRFQEGDNVLRIPNIEYKRLDIYFSGQTGLTFDIEKMQFRETKPFFSMDKYVKIFFSVFATYICITAIAGRILKNKRKLSLNPVISGLQSVFMYVGASGEAVFLKYSHGTIRRMRAILFALLSVGMQIAYVFRLYNKCFQLVALFFTVIIVLIAFLCWEKPLKRLNWNNGLVISWIVLWILSMASDFVVDKSFQYVGYYMLFVMGFLFFMWGNMSQREELLLDFCKGIQWSFYVITIYCYLFRPYLPGYRYSGYNSGPNGFAMYLIFVLMSALAQMHFDATNKQYIKEDIRECIVIGLCINFLWKTQSTANLMLAALVAVVYSLKVWINKKRLKWSFFIACICVFGISYGVNDFCVYNISRALNLEIKYNSDFYIDTVTEHPFLVDVKAAEPGNDNRILYKLQTSTSLDELTTGRTKYWKAYLRDMNLWGHKNNAYFYGKRNRAHNGILAMMHRYGVVTAVPYIIMLLYYVCFSVKYFIVYWKDKKCAYFVLSSMLISGALLLVENLETPFVWLCWYGVYLVMGVFFDEEKSIEVNETRKYSKNFDMRNN